MSDVSSGKCPDCTEVCKPIGFDVNNMNTFGHLYIMVTHECNFKCHYCFNCAEGTQISLEDSKKAIDLLVKHKPPMATELSITFFGGEPLLGYELIKNVKAYCRSAYPNIKWIYDLTTNFSIMNQTIYEEVILDPDFYVLISLDGREQDNIHRVFRNSGEPTYGTVLHNIKNIMLNPMFNQEARDPTRARLDHWHGKETKEKFGIRATFSKKDIGTLFDRFKWLHQNFGIRFVLMQVDDESWDDVDFDLYSSQMRQIIAYIEEKQTKELYACIKFFNDAMASFRNLFLGYPNSQQKSCGQAIGQFAVDYTGKIAPCHRLTNINLMREDSPFLIGTLDTGLDEKAILRIRNLDSEVENQCVARDCKNRGACAFGCFGAGASTHVKEDNLFVCNGGNGGLRNFHEFNYRIISDLFFCEEVIPFFRNTLNIHTEVKVNFLFKRLMDLETRVGNTMENIEKLLRIMEETQER